jgi:hypothetical protein
MNDPLRQRMTYIYRDPGIHVGKMMHHNSTLHLIRTFTVVAALIGAGTAACAAAAQAEWLSLGSKHWAPTVIKKSGIGTANAVAEAKVTRQEIEGWCANWAPGDRACVQRELASAAAKKTYRASADCTAGRITAVDGQTYTLAGTWDSSDIGAGRTRWRDASGNIVGRDNASGGLGIAQQWEVLCPGPLKVPHAAAAVAPQRAPGAPAAQFTVGQEVEAQYGRAWVRGHISKIRQVSGPTGPELAYEVRLENGQRGVLPARMLRTVASR